MKPTYEELEATVKKLKIDSGCYKKGMEASNARLVQLAAENAGLKSKLIFWDWDDPETSYDSPEELAEAFSLNYNEEFTVMVAARMPNRVYRVCESWGQECKLELVEGAEVETPATDAFLAEVRAQGVEMLREHPAIKLCYLTHVCDEFAAELRKGDAQ